MFVVDTNIFLYAAIESFAEHTAARQCLEKWRAERPIWHSTWSIFYEFLRVSTHSAVLQHPLTPQQAWSFLEAIHSSHGFSLLHETAHHGTHIAEISEISRPVVGNLWHDAHIVALMREHGIREIMTADTDFHKFPHLRVTNPVM